MNIIMKDLTPVPFGTDCQEWAKQVLNECRSEAKRQRDIRRQAG